MANFTVQANPLTLKNVGNALIVLNGVHYSGVVGPGGPQTALINCSSINPNWYNGPLSTPPVDTPGKYYNLVPAKSPDGSSDFFGPDGIAAMGSDHIIFDGLKIMNCGLTSANIAMFGNSIAEIANCILGNGGVRGIWVILTTRASIHNTEIFGSVKFAIDLDANSGP